MINYCMDPSRLRTLISFQELGRASTLTVEELRSAIRLRDRLWSAVKSPSLPDAEAVLKLRKVNGAIIRVLLISGSPLPSPLTLVEMLLAQLCEVFCSRCDIEIASVSRRGSPTIDLAFLRGSFELAAADEELPPGQL